MLGAAAIAETAASFPGEWCGCAQCPACGRCGLLVFYAVTDVPVHSCTVMLTREAALRAPRHDVRLGLCPGCGFIGNTVFDASAVRYAEDYDGSQAFSPTFDRFARDLARRLIGRHRLRGRTVLEIGCGKGEFLALLCEMGACRGIGVDPAFDPGRSPGGGGSRIRFIREPYGDRHAQLAADLVICRHTLEHISPALEFLRLLRRNIGQRSEAAVFFEVPDAVRTLREGAFWDLYYEHCGYFSAGSLARVFRAAGFEVVEVSLAYGEQYLLITARPAGGMTAPALQREPDLDELGELVEAFPRSCGAALRGWRDRIAAQSRAGRRVAIWGSGSKGVSFLTTLRLRREIEFVVDVNPHKHGRFMPGTGQEIVAPESLVEHRPDLVVVMNPIYVPEIRRRLSDLGLAPELAAV